MIFAPTALPGVFAIEATPHRDDRGAFGRLYCAMEFASAGIDFTPVQMNLSTNVEAGTLRGMHFQKPPYAEAKTVRVIRGRALDVVLDLRPGPTMGEWIGVELTAEGMEALYLPEGVAHGFLTLEPDTHILYQMGRAYVPGHADGVRWDDPSFGIDWPAPPKVIAPQDRDWPDFSTRTDMQQGS